MARRPSAASMPSSASLLSPTHSEASLHSTGNGTLTIPARSSSFAAGITSPQLDSDELFTKHTIAEVKNIQQRLRADADAKQEELRLMVGERYRDLLQASTTIISIARSSKRVIEALDETREAILTQEQPPLPKDTTDSGKQNAHLHALQQLSAHMKLLLDAPEHLWRLIERKKYFPAAWLFLLARVVHRALVSDDDQDEEHWNSQGIDVLEQFPLIQRQWDAVSQFRSQIIHRSTMSLREYTTPVEDTCGTLLGLHFLDSRPLMETLAVLLSQRTKTLHTVLGRSLEPLPSTPSPTSNGTSPQIINGHVSAIATRAAPVREVRSATQVALEAIISTTQTARTIFGENPTTKRSMVGTVLDFIHSDSLVPKNKLPLELQLTTQSLLATLPSSTHFLLLPSSLREYKPYVDLTSASLVVSQTQFTSTLDQWFTKSTQGLSSALARWFSELRTAKDVWSVRTSTRTWISSYENALGEHEMNHVTGLLDEVCRRRMIEIRKVALNDTEAAFTSKLRHIVVGEGIYEADLSPMDHLFQTPPQPHSSKAGFGHSAAETSVQKYRASLRKQLQGRSAFLDELSNILENCAKALQLDLSHVLLSKGEATEALVEGLKEAYRPNADLLCDRVAEILETVAEGALTDTSLKGAMFIGQTAEELAVTSPFVSSIGCSNEVAKRFRSKTTALHDKIIDRWRDDTVKRILEAHDPLYTNAASPSGPSSTLVQSLLSLSTSVQEPGVSGDPTRKQDIAQGTLRLFVTQLCASNVWDDIPDEQAIWDLAFLQQMAKTWGEDGDWLHTIDAKLEFTIKEADEDDVPDETVLTAGSSEYLARTQVLFASLLPPRQDTTPVVATSPKPGEAAADKLSSLLVFGTPVLDQTFHAALDLAKPSSRFGLLLVGATLNP